MISRSIKQNRYEFVDCAKGIAAIFVVIGHYGSNVFLRNLGYSFHIPMFFIISGFFINTKKSFISFIENKIFKFIIPVIIYYLIENIAGGGSIYSILTNFSKDFISCFYGSYYIPESLKNIFVPLSWFTFCLFAADIIFYLVVRIFKNKKYIILLISVLLSVLGFYLSNFGIHKIGNNIRLPYSFDLALYTQIYLCIGWLSFKTINNIKINKRMLFLFVVVLFSCVAIISTEYIFNVPNYFIMDMNRRSISYISLLFSLLSCFVILMVSKKIGTTPFLSKIFSYLGRISLIMFFFQGFEIPFIRQLYNNNALSCILRIIQSVVISEIIRFVPFVNSSFGLKSRLNLKIRKTNNINYF